MTTYDPWRRDAFTGYEDPRTLQGTFAATPTKIRKSGEWGARVATCDLVVGDTLTIRARSGNSWRAKITGIVWARNGVSICETTKGR